MEIDEKADRPNAHAEIGCGRRLGNGRLREQVSSLHKPVVHAEYKCEQPNKEWRGLAGAQPEREDEVPVRVVHDEQAHQHEVNATQVGQLVFCSKEDDPHDRHRQRRNFLGYPGQSVVYTPAPPGG